MKRLHYFFLLFLIFSQINTLAQTTDTTDISYYFDDGDISISKNILKLNVASLVTGDLNLSYERKIANWFAIEVAGGVLLPYYTPELFEIAADNNEITKPEGGYSFSVQPKFYLFSDAPEGGYFSLQFRKRHYILNDLEMPEIGYQDFTINFGSQFNLVHRLVLDYHLGVGFRYKTYHNRWLSGPHTKIGGICMPLALKFGYLF